MSIATEFRNARFFSSTRSLSFCFFEIFKIWNRILIEKKSIFYNILNTMFNFSDATAKIKSLFVKILIIFQNTNSSQFSTFTKRCNFDYESIFWNFNREKNFLSRFFKIFFLVIKIFFFFEFVENSNWKFFVTKNFDAFDMTFFEMWISENWLFFDFSSINFRIANEMTIKNRFFFEFILNSVFYIRNRLTIIFLNSSKFSFECLKFRNFLLLKK